MQLEALWTIEKLETSGESMASLHHNEKQCLVDARHHCTKHLLRALKTKRTPEETLPDQVSRSLQEWLKDMSDIQVIKIYENVATHLPNHNGWIATSNDTIHNCTGSATNAVLMGNAQQSRNALFYVVPYLCKNKVALEACLIALEHAQASVIEHPSVASDTGTTKRHAQHMFTMVVNSLSRSIQLSDTQVALSLLKLGTEFASDSFNFFGADAGVNWFLHHLFHERISHTTEDSASSSDDAASETRDDHDDDDESIPDAVGAADEDDDACLTDTSSDTDSKAAGQHQDDSDESTCVAADGSTDGDNEPSTDSNNDSDSSGMSQTDRDIQFQRTLEECPLQWDDNLLPPETRHLHASIPAAESSRNIASPASSTVNSDADVSGTDQTPPTIRVATRRNRC